MVNASRAWKYAHTRCMTFLKWTRVRICAETYGFARQKTRGGSMNLILISWMSFLIDF
jgi:hypothetical protein